MPYLATINLRTVLRLVSILASRAYGSISIVCGSGGIPPRLAHAQTAETRPFLLLLFGPGNEARSYLKNCTPTTRIPCYGGSLKCALNNMVCLNLGICINFGAK